MANYNGLYVRTNLGQSNTIPRPGALSISPDIVPTGPQPLDDPQRILSDNYEADLGKALQAQKPNYFYLRAKNYSSAPIDDNTDGNRPRLFWTRASLITYPSQWQEITQTASENPQQMIADAGTVGVTTDPFVWIPNNIQNDHYCLISLVPSPGYDNSVPDMKQMPDFAGWVAQHGGVGWRNMEIINSGGATYTSKIHYDQGTEGCPIQFSLICTNLPIGTKISFSAGEPGPVPPIYLPPTIVVTYPRFATGITCNVPPNYVSDIYFYLETPAGVPIPPGASVTLQAAYPASPGSALHSLAFSAADIGIPTAEDAQGSLKGEAATADYQNYQQQLRELHAAIGPAKLIIVGSFTWQWQ